MADRAPQGVEYDVNRCAECGLPQHPSPEVMPPLQLTDEQLAALHQWARAFNAFARQVPADRPYSALDMVHWLTLEKSASGSNYRSEPAGRPARKKASDRLQLVTQTA